MTERKPTGMSFASWIDQQIADAEKRGVFDDLPGAGKPLDIRPEGGDYGQAWVRDYALREGVPPEEFLPTPLRLRRETERLAEAVAEMRSEQEVRQVVADLNRRIVEWRRIPVGPPVHVRLVNADEMAARWRAAQQARRPAEGRRPAAAGARRRAGAPRSDEGEARRPEAASAPASGGSPRPSRRSQDHRRRWPRLRWGRGRAAS